jgi:hypothetical protein
MADDDDGKTGSEVGVAAGVGKEIFYEGFVQCEQETPYRFSAPHTGGINTALVGEQYKRAGEKTAEKGIKCITKELNFWRI